MHEDEFATQDMFIGKIMNSPDGLYMLDVESGRILRQQGDKLEHIEINGCIAISFTLGPDGKVYCQDISKAKRTTAHAQIVKALPRCQALYPTSFWQRGAWSFSQVAVDTNDDAGGDQHAPLSVRNRRLKYPSVEPTTARCRRAFPFQQSR